MSIGTCVAILFGAIIVAGWAYGTYLERHPERTQAGQAMRAAYDADVAQLADDNEYRLIQAARAIESQLPLMVESMFAAGVAAAEQHGAGVPEMPQPMTETQRRANRLARQAQRAQYGEPVDLDTVPYRSPVADDWAAMTNELGADDTPTQPIPVIGPTWWVVTSTVTTDTQWAVSAYDAEQAHMALHPDARIRACVPAQFK